MKKAISFVLVLAICLGLCGCGSNVKKDSFADVKNALIGTWSGKIGASFYSSEYDADNFYTWVAFIFESDGSVRTHAQLCHKNIGTVDIREYLGTYTIQDGNIKLSYTKVGYDKGGVIKHDTPYSGSDSLQYTLQNGKLSVYISGIELEKD